MNSKRYEKQTLWEQWIRKPIFATRGVYNIGSRYSVLRNFIEEGLFPFVKEKGYVFFDSSEQVTLSFLRYLFALYTGQKVIFHDPHEDIFQDHIFEFEHRFDSLEMEEFWEKWKHIEDFEEGHYAFELQYTLPLFLWPSLNIENSPITLKIEAILDEMDSVEEQEWRKESKGREDPYLHDSSKINYEDRHWH